jgi:hypothetical protein
MSGCRYAGGRTEVRIQDLEEVDGFSVFWAAGRVKNEIENEIRSRSRISYGNGAVWF